MTPEEQRALAIECGISIGCDHGDIWYYAVYPEELAAYTAAVEAKERERICKAREGWKLVPIEPTDDMIKGAWVYANYDSNSQLRAIYEYMIETAPEEP